MRRCSGESVLVRASKPRLHRGQFAARLRRQQLVFRLDRDPQLHPRHRQPAQHRPDPGPRRPRPIRNDSAERLQDARFAGEFIYGNA